MEVLTKSPTLTGGLHIFNYCAILLSCELYFVNSYLGVISDIFVFSSVYCFLVNIDY